MVRFRGRPPAPVFVGTAVPRLAPAGPGLCLSTADVQRLGDGEALIYDGVLGIDVAAGVRTEIGRRAEARALTAAGVGRGAEHRRDGRIRSDLTTWLELADPSPPLAALVAGFERVQSEVNEAAWLGLRRFEVQLALYPGGGVGYARHRDAFSRDARRRLTAIYYANPGWTSDHQGRLRIFPPSGVAEVDPIADRLGVFLSEHLEHAVLPPAAPRCAATAWFSHRPA